MIGFKPQTPRRIAVRNDQGEKLGYLASKNGRQVWQSLDGKTIAILKGFKYQLSAGTRQGAQGGSFANPDYWND